MTQETTEHNVLQLVACRVGQEDYAVDILIVQEIIRMVEVTPVPKASAVVRGVINLRGRIIPVLDARRCFGLPDIEPSGKSRIIVVNLQGKSVGILVDSVAHVIRIDATELEPPPALGSMVGQEYIKGVGKARTNLIMVLNIPALLAQHLEPLRELLGT